MQRVLAVACVLVFASMPVLAQQANSAFASSVWAGNDHAMGGNGPIATTATGSTVSWDLSGESNQPFLWAYTPGASSMGALTFPTMGTIDLNPVTTVIVADGGVVFTPSTLLDMLMNLNFSGEASFSLPVCNTFVEGGPTAHQILFASPSTAGGMLLSAATDLSGVCQLNLNHGDDDSITISPSLCSSTEFYDQSYTQIVSNANGSITFGGGDTEFSPSQGAFDAGLPRISAFWTDLSPQLGTVGFTDSPTGWSLAFTNVPEYATSGSSNSFTVSYDCTTGAITCDYPAASQSATELFLGITPGGSIALNFPNLAQQPPVTFLAHSATCAGAPFVPAGGSTLDSINFFYTDAGTPFDLSGCSIVFTPSTFGGLGSGSANTYSAN